MQRNKRKATIRNLSAEELVKNVQSKLLKAGLDCTKYTRQLKDIASLFEPERSRAELITEGKRAGSWDMVCYFKGIRHCFHSAREVAATFGIPVVKAVVLKRRRDEDELPKTETGYAHADEDCNELIDKLMKTEPQKKKPDRSKDKKGRMGSRFANHKLVKAINANAGLEVSCGNLKARLVSANLGGMTFELLDEFNRPCGDMVPPSQLAKRSCLAHQNNAWKSIKVDGLTLDAWVGRLQDAVEQEDRAAGILVPMQRDKGVDDEDDSATADGEENDGDSGNDSDQQPSCSRGQQGLELLSGAALQRMRNPDVPRAQQQQRQQPLDSNELAWGSLRRQDDPASIPGHSGMFIMNTDMGLEGGLGAAPVAEALMHLYQPCSAAIEDPGTALLQQQLHQAHSTIMALSRENAQLCSDSEGLDRLLAQKEEQIAAEHSARLDAEARLEEQIKVQSGDQVLKLTLNVIESADDESARLAARVVKLEELLAKTVQTMNYLLHEVEKSGVV